MSLPRFSVRNSVLVNLVMILVIAMGTYSLLVLPRELFPQVRLNRVIVAVAYPGASPEEVEKLVTKPIEDEIVDVDHVDMYLSKSVEGQARLNVIFEQVSEDKFLRAYQDLRQEVDKVELPEVAEDPVFLSLESSTWVPMATVVISGDLTESRMKELAEELEDEIEGLKGVDAVTLSGLRERQIWVEVDAQRLYRHGLTMESVASQLGRQNVSLASGSVQLGDHEFLVRSIEEFNDLEDIGRVVLKRDPVGNHVRLADVASVRDTFEEARSLSRLDGKPSVSLNIYKNPQGDSLEMVDQFRVLAEAKQRTLPENVHIQVTGDFSDRIESAIKRLSNNGLFGGFLVLLLLLLFLGWRNSILVAWGIPITFLLTFAFIDLYGESLNEPSLFALVLVLGMVVDDAIVVIENIARYLNRGFAPREAAIKGTEEVFWPVLTSSLTTVAAFLPLMLLPGVIGEWMKVIPVCVSFALVASLFESLVLLPSHAADLSVSDSRRRRNWINRAIRSVASKYRVLIGVLLRRRMLYLPLMLLAISSSFLVLPLVGVNLYEDDDMNLFFVRIWMPEGSRLSATDRVSRQFEEVAMSLPKSEVENVVTQVGQLDLESERLVGKDVAQVIINLRELNQRTASVDELIEQMRSSTQEITGYRRMEIAKMSAGPPVGKPVEIKVKGDDFNVLAEIASEIQEYLQTVPGVHSLQDDFERGQSEIRIRVDESRAQLLGLDESDVAGQIQFAFGGVVATEYRDGDDEIDVVVKYQMPDRDTLEDLHGLRIPTRSGGLVPFRSVAAFSVERGYADINRFDGERAITVSAEVDDGITTPVQVTELVRQQFGDLGKNYPGYRLDFRGEFKEFEEAFDNVLRLFLIGVILIYIILGAQFRSYLQPILVLFSIPFAFAGAMLCLLINGYMFSINVMFGMVALSGVAANDSIVLISFINNARARGASLHRAVLKGCVRRLRPIFLTTVTTVFGLLPMALGLGGESVVWMPLASTIVWGLGVATLLILLVMPPLYAVLEDLRGGLNVWVGRGAKPIAAMTGESGSRINPVSRPIRVPGAANPE